MKPQPFLRIFVCSIFGLSVIALGFARDNTTTTPTPTPTPDMAVALADMAMLVPVMDDRPGNGQHGWWHQRHDHGFGIPAGRDRQNRQPSPSRARRCRRTVRRSHLRHRPTWASQAPAMSS